MCDFCDKKFLNKYTLVTHQKNTKSCLKLQEIKNNSVHTTIKNTQNNYIQNMKNITDDVLNDNINNLTIDHILKGSGLCRI